MITLAVELALLSHLYVVASKASCIGLRYNPAANIRKPPQGYDLCEWNLVLQTNLTSAFVCSQAAYPRMCAVGPAARASVRVWRRSTMAGHGSWTGAPSS